MIFNRIWSMPSKDTFTIKPIAKLLKKYVKPGELWIDAFAGFNSPASLTNDLNPKAPTDYHLLALDFFKGFSPGSVHGVLFDPPYSVRQIKECYEKYGLEVTQETTRSDWWTKHKKEIARISPEYVISFGWNSNGVGKKLGYQIEEILLVAHGGNHNDTIVVVEKRLPRLTDFKEVV